MIYDDRINYSIVNIDGNVVVRKRFFGFVDVTSDDSIDIRNIKDSGANFIVFTGRHETGKFVYNRYSDFNFYSYDLDKNHFVYYGNDPVVLNRINALPSNIQKVFKKKKVEFNYIRFLEE